MKTKIISKSIAFGVCQIASALNQYYAEHKTKNLNAFFNGCREIARVNQMTVDFPVVEICPDPNDIDRDNSQIQAIFTDMGAPRK